MIKIKRSEVTFQTKTEGGIEIVNVGGQMDAFSTPDAKAEFKKLTDARKNKIILNLQNLAYINSTAIGSVVALAQQVRRNKGDLKLCCMKEDIRKVFDLVGASKILEIFSNEQEAIKSF